MKYLNCYCRRCQLINKKCLVRRAEQSPAEHRRTGACSAILEGPDVALPREFLEHPATPEDRSEDVQVPERRRLRRGPSRLLSTILTCHSEDDTRRLPAQTEHSPEEGRLLVEGQVRSQQKHSDDRCYDCASIRDFCSD